MGGKAMASLVNHRRSRRREWQVGYSSPQRAIRAGVAARFYGSDRVLLAKLGVHVPPSSSYPETRPHCHSLTYGLAPDRYDSSVGTDFLPLQLLLATFAGWANRRQAQLIAYLVEENRVLRERLGKRRLRLTDDQRRRLAAKARHSAGESSPASPPSSRQIPSFAGTANSPRGSGLTRAIA